jgi:hypothetical protein
MVWTFSTKRFHPGGYVSRSSFSLLRAFALERWRSLKEGPSILVGAATCGRAKGGPRKKARDTSSPQHQILFGRRLMGVLLSLILVSVESTPVSSPLLRTGPVKRHSRPARSRRSPYDPDQRHRLKGRFQGQGIGPGDGPHGEGPRRQEEPAPAASLR